MTTMIRRSLGALVLFAATACVGSANTISYYVDVFSGTTTGAVCPGGVCPGALTSTLATSGGTINVSIPKLDQSSAPLGYTYNLTNVAITLAWQAVADITINNFKNASIPYNYAKGVTDMTLTAGTSVVSTQAVAATGAGTATCCNVLNGPVVYLGQTIFTGLTGSDTYTSNASNLAFFQGYGASSFSGAFATTSIDIRGNSSSPYAGQLAYQGDGQMGSILSVTYTYDQVQTPEPATAAMLGSALIGLGFFVRRRSRKA